jgi:hypothetical protein
VVGEINQAYYIYVCGNFIIMFKAGEIVNYSSLTLTIVYHTSITNSLNTLIFDVTNQAI